MLETFRTVSLGTSVNTSKGKGRGTLCSGPCAPVTEHTPPYITWGERRSLHTLHHAELAPYGSFGVRFVVDVNVVVAGVLPYGRAQRTRYRLAAAGGGPGQVEAGLVRGHDYGAGLPLGAFVDVGRRGGLYAPDRERIAHLRFVDLDHGIPVAVGVARSRHRRRQVRHQRSERPWSSARRGGCFPCCTFSPACCFASCASFPTFCFASLAFFSACCCACCAFFSTFRFASCAFCFASCALSSTCCFASFTFCCAPPAHPVRPNTETTATIAAAMRIRNLLFVLLFSFDF